jgi:hypothetical protein
VPRADAGDLLCLGQPRLTALLLGDLGRESDHRDGVALGVEHRRLMGEERPLPEPVLDVDRLAGAQHLLVLRGPALDGHRVEELGRHPPDHLLSGPADQLAAGMIDPGDPAVGILDVEQHRHAVENLDQAGRVQRGASMRIHSAGDAIGMPIARQSDAREI